MDPLGIKSENTMDIDGRVHNCQCMQYMTLGSSHNTRASLLLWDKTIKEVESYKYLGVHIDSQLRWNVQAQNGVTNATKWVMQFRRLMKISTGMGVKLLRQLYIAVLLPKMTYTLNIWYTPPTKLVGQRKSISLVGYSIE